jgi:hypothetical protein
MPILKSLAENPKPLKHRGTEAAEDNQFQDLANPNAAQADGLKNKR